MSRPLRFFHLCRANSVGPTRVLRVTFALGLVAAACSSEPSSSSNGGAATQNGSSDATSAASTGGSGSGSTTRAASASTADATSDASASAPASSVTSAGGAGPCDLFQPTQPSQADCAGYCEALATAACPNDPAVADCTAACIEEVAYYAPSCEAETVAYIACLAASGTVMCNGDGNATFSGCPEEKHAFNACTACVAVPGASECTCCEVSTCCIQVAELLENDDWEEYRACRIACNFNPGCWEDCDAMYPETGADFDQYNFCIGGPCGDACFQ